MELAAEVPADSEPKAAGNRPADRRKHGRSRITNGVWSRVDGRSVNARRVRDLAEAFMAALGLAGVNDLNTRAQVKKAAELVALAEATRTAALTAGTQTDLTALIRIEGEARRTLRALGLKTEPPPAKARGLELARRRWAEDAEKAKAREASATHTTEPPDDRAA
jgi:hypothetical protein